jgi:hypothetical protein
MTVSQNQVKLGLHLLEQGYIQNVTGTIYCVLNLTDQNLIRGEMKNGLNSGNSCRISVNNSFSSFLLYKNKKLEYKTAFFAKKKFGVLTIGKYIDQGEFNLQS